MPLFVVILLVASLYITARAVMAVLECVRRTEQEAAEAEDEGW